MPVFNYEAYDSSGRLIVGELVCATRNDALEQLTLRDATPVMLSEGPRRAERNWLEMEVLSAGRIPSAMLALITRELATLLSASVPVIDALRIVAAEPDLPRKARRVVENLVERISAGSSLSQAMADEGGAFARFYCRMIAAGERSGQLGPVLTDLADHLDSTAGMRASLTSALLYPAILMASAVVTLGIIVIVLIPALAPLFTEAGAAPPLSISIVISVQSYIAEYWRLLLAICVATPVAGIAALRRREMRRQLHSLVLRMPVAGRIVALHQTGRYAHTLSTLLRNGIPFDEAMRLAEEQLSNLEFQSAARYATLHVERGERLSRAMAERQVFPELARRLAAIGEETGQLGIMLHRLAEICDATFLRRLARISSLVAPILTLVIGFVVGAIVFSVMSTIVSLNELAIR